MRSILQDYFAKFEGKKVAVIGIGVSNLPLIKKLLEYNIDVTACDRRERESFGDTLDDLEARGLKTNLGGDYLSRLDGMDVIFRTPGMRPDLPELTRAIEQGAELTSEMEAFISLCPCGIIAVTGSDGKTTTTTMIAGLLERAGYRTFVGGNIGRPLLCELDEMRPDDRVVLELSSFQLFTMRQSPGVAVVTNLSPNHLDVHRDMVEYVAAKQNIYLYQDACDKVILNADNEITAAFAEQARGEVTLFSRRKYLERGVCVKDGKILHDGRPVLSTEDILVPGVHNVENLMAAIAAVDGLVPDEVIRDFAKEFGGVAHRIELVRELNGVRWYNDSIASSPSRTIAGLRSFNEKVILIAGGYDKHIPYDVLGPEITSAVKHLFLTGATAEKIRTATQNAPDYCEDELPITMCANLEAAVKGAFACATEGDTVILSPASASFDCFKNFEERGNVFKQYVAALPAAENHQ